MSERKGTVSGDGWMEGGREGRVNEREGWTHNNSKGQK
jgi:hypothetical protein